MPETKTTAFTESLTGQHYVAAAGIHVAASGDTAALQEHMRTVATTLTTGTLTLRYAPHAPRPSGNIDTIK